MRGRLQSRLAAENDCEERLEVQARPFFTPVFSVGLDLGWCYLADQRTGSDNVHTANQVGDGAKMNKSGATIYVFSDLKCTRFMLPVA